MVKEDQVDNVLCDSEDEMVEVEEIVGEKDCSNEVGYSKHDVNVLELKEVNETACDT